jgi:hypothetical protein
MTAAAALLFTAVSSGASPAGSVCDQRLMMSVPARADGALTGSQFVERARHVSGPQRDALVRSELLAGNVPAFLRRLEAVTVRGNGTEVTICVLPDYLALGSDRDFVFVPMGLEAALEVASRYGFVLPTRRLVNAIYEESTVKLKPQPLPAGDQMGSTGYLVHHNQMIGEQRVARGAALG